MDSTLGWLLAMPRDVALFALATLTTAILIAARIVATDRGLLRRIQADKRRLKELIRGSRHADDHDTTRRYKITLQRVKLKAARQEALPLLLALIPIAVLATWAFHRVAYIPPKAGEPLVLIARLPLSAGGSLIHIVPFTGVTAEGGWIRQIVVPHEGQPAWARAEWTLRFPAGETPYDLQLRYAGKTYNRGVLVGTCKYASPLTTYPGDGLSSTEVIMQETRLFGFVPGIPAIGLPAWLVAYLLISVPLVFLVRRLFRIP